MLVDEELVGSRAEEPSFPVCNSPALKPPGRKVSRAAGAPVLQVDGCRSGLLQQRQAIWEADMQHLMKTWWCTCIRLLAFCLARQWHQLPEQQSTVVSAHHTNNVEDQVC